MAEVCYQIITQLFEYVKNLSLRRTSRNILAPAVKDLILMAPRLYIESKRVLPEFWLALDEGVDGCWKMKIWFNKN